MWKVGNGAAAWAVDGVASKGYYYTDAHKQYVKPEQQTAAFEGSCYGMAAVSALTRNGDIAVEDFTRGQFSKIWDITRPNMSLFTKSFVNTCWATAKPYGYDYSLNCNNQALMNDQEMLTYMEFITYT